MRASVVVIGADGTRSRSGQRASMTMTRPMPTTRVSAMFLVRQATSGGQRRRRRTAAARGRSRPRGAGRRARRWPRARPAGSGAAAAARRAARRRAGERTRGTTRASRRCRCRPARSPIQTRLTAPHPGRAAAGSSSRGPRRSIGRLGEGAGRDAAERTEEHGEVARAGLVPRAARRRPPTSAATAAGRELMAGTRSTRNTSGTAKSRGSESGTAEPMRIPMIVQICQLTQSNRAAPK